MKRRTINVTMEQRLNASTAPALIKMGKSQRKQENVCIVLKVNVLIATPSKRKQLIFLSTSIYHFEDKSAVTRNKKNV